MTTVPRHGHQHGTYPNLALNQDVRSKCGSFSFSWITFLACVRTFARSAEVLITSLFRERTKDGRDQTPGSGKTLRGITQHSNSSGGNGARKFRTLTVSVRLSQTDEAPSQSGPA